MKAPPRTSPIVLPAPLQPSTTSISSKRWPASTSTAPEICGCSARRAISEPEDLYGEMTRSAPARRSFASESSREARATIAALGLSSRTVSVMKMFSASESTHATTARARSTPARRSDSSSLAWPSITRTPMPDAFSKFSGLGSITT